MEGLYSFLESNSIYIVLFITLVVWLGIYLFVYSTDKRLKSIEQELTRNEQNEE